MRGVESRHERIGASSRSQSWRQGFLCLSTLLPITPPRTPPTTPPMMAPLTLFRLVVAPRTAPAAAPMAASRWVCLTTVPPLLDTLPLLVVVVVPLDPLLLLGLDDRRW